MERKTKSCWRRRAILAATLVVVLLLALVGCQPQSASTPAGNNAESSQEGETDGLDVESMGYSVFTEKDAGYVDDTLFTTDCINAGNRGCNACHEDIWELVADSNPLVHLAASEPGYGRNAGWEDCYGCHKGNPLSGRL